MHAGNYRVLKNNAEKQGQQPITIPIFQNHA
jgi:hypothetical protein